MNKIAYFLDTGFVYATKEKDRPHDVEPFLYVVRVGRRSWD